MIRLSTLVLFLFSMVAQVDAQREETIFNHDGHLRLTGIWGGSTNAIVDFKNDFDINSAGFFAFEINNDFLIGWSGYKSDLTDDGKNIEIKGNDLFLGYTFRSHEILHPIIYLQAGSGKLEVEDLGSDNVFVAQPTIGAEVNIARFFRLSIDGGYRFMSGNDLPGISNQELTGPVLNLRFKFGWSWR